jgi:23S rRNA (cytosine1962-C5)-methyltransferase
LSLPVVRLRPSAKVRLRAAHPWIYRDDIEERGGIPAGAVVVEREGGAVHGVALYSPQSRIALRWLLRGKGPHDAFDLAALVRTRVLESAARRAALARECSQMRLLASEADGVPGLIIDRYGTVAALQVTNAALEPLIPMLADLLVQELGCSAVVERDEVQVRKLEGLELRSGVLRGSVDGPIEVREGEVRCAVDVLAGQKTGAFLDQRQNHLAFGAQVRARGARRVLDAFCHDGLFGLQALAGGAEEVIFLDSSAPALERVQQNLARNGWGERGGIERRAANAFHELRALRDAGARFDAIALDPPAFAKSRQEVQAAWRGYREINAQALRLLNPGGVLWTCSCSYNLSPADFEEVVREAAADADRRVLLREIRGQADDHPVLLTLPESRYLKCLVLETP